MYSYHTRHNIRTSTHKKSTTIKVSKMFQGKKSENVHSQTWNKTIFILPVHKLILLFSTFLVYLSLGLSPVLNQRTKYTNATLKTTVYWCWKAHFKMNVRYQTSMRIKLLCSNVKSPSNKVLRHVSNNNEHIHVMQNLSYFGLGRQTFGAWKVCAW